MLFPTIKTAPLPDSALLRRFNTGDQAPGSNAYVDCFVTELAGKTSLEPFVQAFYTSPVFKVERKLLALFGDYAASDDDARRLASGEATTFSAWRVEDRDSQQLLLSDLGGRTRSWLMVEHDASRSTNFTRLFFGSAVVPVTNRKTGKSELGIVFHMLTGFHKLYSRALLSSARRTARSRLAKA